MRQLSNTTEGAVNVIICQPSCNILKPGAQPWAWSHARPQSVSDLARPVSKQRGNVCKAIERPLNGSYRTRAIEESPSPLIPLFNTHGVPGVRTNLDPRPRRCMEHGFEWLVLILCFYTPNNRDKIYLKLNMDLEREYFRNKIPDEIQLLSRNQRSLALNVGRGRGWGPHILMQVLQFKLQARKTE